jgi:hypothetical protein
MWSVAAVTDDTGLAPGFQVPAGCSFLVARGSVDVEPALAGLQSR